MKSEIHASLNLVCFSGDSQPSMNDQSNTKNDKVSDNLTVRILDCNPPVPGLGSGLGRLKIKFLQTRKIRLPLVLRRFAHVIVVAVVR